VKRITCKSPDQNRITDIFCGDSLLDNVLSRNLKQDTAKARIIIDAKVWRLHREYLQSASLAGPEKLMVQGQERSKSPGGLERIWHWLYDQNTDRTSTVVAIGGGVITDLAGLAAATYMRGVNLILVPTTLLGQVDAAIGGKTAMNFRRTKNTIGAFYPPLAVICDVHFLSTLPIQRMKDGIVEALKVFAVTDAKLFKRYAGLKDELIHGQGTAPLIERAVAAKCRVVEQDPLDRKQRRLLNFGHTTGHAYEILTGRSHGESVAFGILVAVELSLSILRLSTGAAGQVRSPFADLYRFVTAGKLKPKQLWQRIQRDKKKRGDNINFVLMPRIGSYAMRSVNFEQFERAFKKTTELLACQTK
jgi:3-dehydroquinate synthase